ncbi:MAG: flagellar export chaperone FlgN [Acidimicrobiia bacterium]|nr:flagellar export chaperone FlgN [Acidimicrobiia bacterium]
MEATRAGRDLMTKSAKLLINERYIALVGVLNRELVLLDRLIFKLAEAELLTRADESRFLGKIFDEVDAVEDDLGSLEVARSMLVGDVTAALGLANDTLTLTQLIEYAPDLAVEPLEGLMRRLTEAMEEVQELRQRGSRLVIERLDQLNAAIDRVEPGMFTQDNYNEHGYVTAPTVTASRFDYSA